MRIFTSILTLLPFLHFILTSQVLISTQSTQSTPSTNDNNKPQLPELNPTSSITNKFRNLEFKCIDDYTSCSGNGKCTSGNPCVCNTGFTTFPENSDIQCNYEMKSQLTAFLCELFLGFGAGHFYCERYSTAVPKLISFLFGIYIICLLPMSMKFMNDKCESDCIVISVACFYYLCVCGLTYWFINDLIMFGTNKYSDGNGVPLLPW